MDIPCTPQGWEVAGIGAGPPNGLAAGATGPAGAVFNTSASVLLGIKAASPPRPE